MENHETIIKEEEPVDPQGLGNMELFDGDII
jgi:hypothetical protein